MAQYNSPKVGIPGETHDDVIIFSGAGAPSDGTTGDNFAGKGSIYIDLTNADLYIQVGTLTSPAYKKVTRAT